MVREQAWLGDIPIVLTFPLLLLTCLFLIEV